MQAAGPEVMQWLASHGVNLVTLGAVVWGGLKLNFRLNELILQHKEYPHHMHVGKTIPADEIIYPMGMKRNGGK